MKLGQIVQNPKKLTRTYDQFDPMKFGVHEIFKCF